MFEVQVTATDAGGLTDVQNVTVTVTDEAAVVGLSVDSSAISEAGGVATATLTRSGDTSGELVVTLASSEPSVVDSPESVTLADGETSTTFDLIAVDDVDGDLAVTITASAAGADDVTVDVTVLDDGPVDDVPVVEDLVVIGSSENDLVQGGDFDDVLVGGLGNDRLEGSAGDDVFITDEINGDSLRNDRDVIDLGDVDASQTGNDVIRDFDTNNFRGGESNFDTLEFTFAGEDFSLSTGRDIDNFVRFIERDGDIGTDALLDGDDLVFVFGRDADDPNIITSSVRLEGVVGDDGLTVRRLERSSVDRLGSNELDILAVDGNVVVDGDADSPVTGGSADDVLVGGLGNDTLTGGAGDDILTGGQTDGGSGRFERDVFEFGDIDANSIGNDVITDFDTNNFRGGESNFDTVNFTFGGQDFSLSTGRDFLDFISFIESDGDTGTDALLDGDDIVLVFGRSEEGFITNSIRFSDIVGDDGLTSGRLRYVSIDPIGETAGEVDVFAKEDATVIIIDEDDDDYPVV